MSAAIEELDVVRLRRPVGSWPTGAEGTVVNHRPGWPTATVEFAERLPIAERSAIDPDKLVVEVDLRDLELVRRGATEEHARPPATRT